MLDALPEAPTEVAALLDRAAELASDFASRAAQHDRDGSFPFENFERLREAGLLNVTLPIARGGAGLGLGDTRRIVQQIAAGDASTALVLSMHYLHHAMLARERAWPAATYDRLCRESMEGIALI